MSTTASSSTLPPPAPTLVLFARGVIASLKLWPAFRIAVEQGWGGPESEQKRTWLASAIVDAFEEARDIKQNIPDAIYVEEMLLQVLVDEFDVVLEDGSAKTVAVNIVNLWNDVMNEGRLDSVTRAESLVEELKGRKVAVEEKGGSDDEWDGEDDSESESEESAPQLLDHERKPGPSHEDPEVDDEGFTLVKSRGRR